MGEKIAGIAVEKAQEEGGGWLLWGTEMRGRMGSAPTPCPGEGGWVGPDTSFRALLPQGGGGG